MTDRSLPNLNRRLVALLLLIILVLVGAGVGTIAFISPDGQTPGVTTPTATPTPTPNATVNVSIVVDGERQILSIDGAMPGDSGTGTLTIRNTGEQAGLLAVANVTLRSDENGIVGPERAVDDTETTGELAEKLEVRIEAQYSSGGSSWVVGGADEYQPLEEIESLNRTLATAIRPGQQTDLVLEWRVPGSAGNQIQSDAVSFSLTVGLVKESAANDTA